MLILNFTKIVLLSEGHTVLLATSGEAGLGIFRKNQLLINLVITDIEMPGLKGFDMARQIRLLAPSVKIIFMTGFTGSSIPKPFDTCPVVRKPFDAAAFLATVRRYIER